MDITDLLHYIDKYFINGIINDTSYNYIDTLTYAIVLGISLFGILKLLKKLNINIDSKFLISVTPYIIAGSSLRVIEDLRMVFTPPLMYLFRTPLIYFFMFAVTVCVLILAVYLERTGRIRDYHWFFFSAGLGWALINITLLFEVGTTKNPYYAADILILGLTTTGMVYAIAWYLKFSLLTDKVNISILFAHLMDASSTYVGIDWLNYYEKHVAPTFFINLAGNYMDHPSLIMYPLKLLVFIPVLYIIDKNFDSKREGNLIGLLKLAILVLGLSPAARNTLRILMGI